MLHPCRTRSLFLKCCLFIYVWPCWALAAAWPFLRGSEWRLLSDRGVRASYRGASPVAERRPSGAWTSVVEARGLSSRGSRALDHRLCRCDSWASLFRDLWDCPAAGIGPVSPVLAGGFSTAGPPWKPDTVSSILCLTDGLSSVVASCSGLLSAFTS